MRIILIQSIILSDETFIPAETVVYLDVATNIAFHSGIHFEISKEEYKILN